MKILITLLVTTTFGFVLEKPQASSFLRSRRESDCGSMPGAEELCREESNSGSDTSNSMDYNLYSATSMNDNDGDATNTVDYSDFYSLSGTDQNNFAADNNYQTLMNYD